MKITNHLPTVQPFQKERIQMPSTHGNSNKLYGSCLNKEHEQILTQDERIATYL
jgi:hypothetical protein